MRLRTFGALATASLVVAGGSLATTAVASPGHHSDRGGRYANFFPGHPGHHPSTAYVSPSAVSTNHGTSCAQATFATIQSAVTAIAANGTVVVCAGTYPEGVAVAQPLTLKGQNAVINATGKNNGVTISSSHVTVEGFTVRGATGEGILAVGTLTPSLVPAGAPAGSTSGVPISDVTITKNIVQGNDQGTPTSAYPECQASNGVPGDCGEGIHLMSVAGSTVSKNYVNGNSGGILLTDEFGPTHGNTIEHNFVTNNSTACGITLPSHNGLAVNPATLVAARSLAGVYDNTVSNNTIFGNGLKGFGAGVVIAAPFPGSAAYNNVVSHNLIEGNGISGVTLHSHAPGAFVGGNQILGNTIGVNNLTGDSPLSPATGPFAAPVQFQANTQTTGILVWSLATPTTVTIAQQHDPRRPDRHLAEPGGDRRGCRRQQRVLRRHDARRPVRVTPSPVRLPDGRGRIQAQPRRALRVTSQATHARHRVTSCERSRGGPMSANALLASHRLVMMMRRVAVKMIVGSAALAWLLGVVSAGQAGVSEWTSSWTALPATSTVVSSAYAQGGETQVYVAAVGGAIFSSPDGGATWNVQESGPSDAISVSAAPSDPSVAYAQEGGVDAGIYRQTTVAGRGSLPGSREAAGRWSSIRRMPTSHTRSCRRSMSSEPRTAGRVGRRSPCQTQPASPRSR